MKSFLKIGRPTSCFTKFKYFKSQIKGFVGIGSAPEFLTRLMWNKFPKKTISTFDHISTSFSIKLKICGQAPVKRVSKKQYAQNGRYPGILRTFKQLMRNDSFLTVLLSNSGIC